MKSTVWTSNYMSEHIIISVPTHLQKRMDDFKLIITFIGGSMINFTLMKLPLLASAEVVKG